METADAIEAKHEWCKWRLKDFPFYLEKRARGMRTRGNVSFLQFGSCYFTHGETVTFFFNLLSLMKIISTELIN